MDAVPVSDYVFKDSSGTEWMRINYDSGAATTAFPRREGGDLELVTHGHFKGAGGTMINNYGRFKVPAADHDGCRRDFKAYLADIHKPLGSAAEFSETHDCLLWKNDGSLMPKNSPVAVGLRKEYWRLRKIHGDCHEIPLYREGQLYSRRGDLQKLSTVELNAQEGEEEEAPGSVNQRQAAMLP